MKVISTVLFAFVMVAAADAAQATTCAKRAQNCVKLGGSQQACFAENRMSACKKSGQYVAPSGRSWEANGR